MDDTGKTRVIDASVVLGALLTDEVYNKTADAILESYRVGQIKLIAPSLITYEIYNGIKSAYIRKRVSISMIDKLIKSYSKLEIELHESDGNLIVTTAISENLSVYDSAYISLMMLERSPFVTADKILYRKIKAKHPATMWIEDFK